MEYLKELSADAAEATGDLTIAAVNAGAFDGLLEFACELHDVASDITDIANAGKAGGVPLARIVMSLIAQGAEVDVTIVDLMEGAVGPDARAA